MLPPKEPVDLVGELAVLRERLSSVEMGDRPRRAVGGTEDWKQRLERLNQPIPADSSAVSGEDEDQRAKKGVGLSELDKRLATLEDLVGPSDPAYDSVSRHRSLCCTLRFSHHRS